MSKSTRIILLFITVTLSALLSGCASSSYAAQPSLNPQAAAGKQVFDSMCSACHSTLPETVIVGPSLAGLPGRAVERIEGLTVEEYLRQSILDPGAYIVEGYNDLMPRTFGEVYDREQIDSLIAYLLTLE
jgi:cytochrome c oxidase subunit 2